MALVLDVGPSDALRVGDTYIVVERKSGSRARLRILGPAEVELMRNSRQEVETAARPLARAEAG